LFLNDIDLLNLGGYKQNYNIGSFQWWFNKSNNGIIDISAGNLNEPKHLVYRFNHAQKNKSGVIL
jgi:hypothetical protein